VERARDSNCVGDPELQDPLNHSIYQVQYSTKDTSPDRGKYVHTAGIVTGIVTQFGTVNSKVYIGSPGGGPWSGVCLYRRGTITDTLRVGDSLDVLATVVDFNLLTELDSVRRVIHGGSSAFETTHVSIATSKLEDYEGVLMRLDTVRMLQGVGGNFAVGTYQLTNYAGTDTTLLYVTSGSQFVGTPVPAGWCRLVCNGSQYNALRELDPRVPGDIAELPADVSVTAILAPGDSVHIGDSVTPTAVIQNMGALNSATNFIVTMRIGVSTMSSRASRRSPRVQQTPSHSVLGLQRPGATW